MISGNDEFVKFLEELGLYTSMVARYGGVLTIYTDGQGVKVLYAKDEKFFKDVSKKVKKEALWLDEELLQKEMLQYAENFAGDVEP